MSNKTISINPSLFSIGGSKTKKNREKNAKPTSVPIISPNVLKNKLLKRIKEHKQRETQNLDNNKKKLEPKIEEIKPSKKSDEILDFNDDFNDEFNDSINYLQTLSKQKRIDDEKAKYDDTKQKRKEEIERRTIRNYHLGGVPMNHQEINMELPDELQEQIIQQSIITEPYKINSSYKSDNVPYGVLKGGLKPSYREWAKTQRSNIVTNPNASLIIQGGTINSAQNARENRLNILKEKIREKNQASEQIMTENLIKKPVETIINTENISPYLVMPSTMTNIITENSHNSVEPNEKIIATKHITKKTIKRKYILGRSQIKQTVGVLIKDRGTRKLVLNAQKELKRRNINDIKGYLKEHNLIKIGSNAPNDIIRKLYETSMLAGEITNSNSDTLLHNFTKEDKQL